MPFTSKQQAKWMFANKPKMAQEWASETPSIKALPKTAAKAQRRARRNRAKFSS